MSWSDVRAALEPLLDAGPEERTARLAEIESADPALAAELRELLAHDESGRAFLERPPSTAPWAAHGLTPQVGLQLGPYTLERPLGAGGMGTVWLAVRENPTRRVALKILASSSWSRDERWRFEYEAEVLAGLAHPSIAQLYEAGSEQRDGEELAWFAMELVEDARDIITWAEQSHAPRAGRLALFGDLCDAVQYGHRRGVIHRDLKPANVLVGRDGRLKLIDFGVARAVEGSRATPSLRTQTGAVVGTLQYMAPEQVAGRTAEIDARCDVYALGVILYRLLAGAPPFDFSNASLAEIARIVREAEPRRPSQIARDLTGDLEWILLEALEKDPARRYQSVAELAEDLRRHAAHEPVLAHAPGALYRLGKFARRNRAQVAIAVALLLGLAFAGAGLWSGLEKARAGEIAAKKSATEATRQGELALREAGRSREVLALVEGLFEGIDDTVEGREVKVADLLDAAVLAPGAIADPQVEFTVRAVRGKLFHRIELYEAARAELERALAVLPPGARAPGERDRELETQALLGGALTRVGEPEQGEVRMRAAVDAARSEQLLVAHVRCLILLLGYLNEKGAFAEVIAGTEELRDIAERADSVETESYADEALAIALQGLGRDVDSLPVLERLWRRQTERFGERDRRTLTAAFNYANSLQGAGRLDEAEELYPQVLSMSREVLGPTHNQTLTVLNNYAMLAVARGDAETALERLDAVVRAYDDRGMPPTAEHLLAINNLGMLRNQRGKFAEAEPVLRRAADLTRDLLAGDDVNGILIRFNHGACLAWMKRWSEAEPILLEEYAKLQTALPEQHPSLGKAVRTIADAYMVNGRPEEAARWRGP